MSSENNIFELHPWIDMEFVQMLVRKSDCDKNLTVTSFRAEKGVHDGKNFSSSAIRLHVNIFPVNDHSIMSRVYFLKVCLQTEDFAKACEECLYYEKEIEVYTEIIPAVERLLHSIEAPARFTAKCFYTDAERGILAFEDLSVGNFVSVQPADGMDKEHLKLSLSTLAKWHATTAVLLLTRPELFDWTTRVMYKNATTVRRFFENIAKTVSMAARNWSGFEKIAEKLINVPSHVYDNIYKEYLPTENGFNVLLHGDMWSNNIMFHYENGRPTDIRIVDFALCKHTNPSYDLSLLLYGSSQSQSIGQADRERLIRFYHTELIKVLEKLQYPKTLPTLIDIQTLVFRFDLYNVLIVLFVIGLRYTDESFDGGFMELSENAQNTNGKATQLYSHPKCIEELQYILEMFDRRGYFDF
ncbi:uncharacterized protein LOC119066001 [Bradysia coprophila]|uniref:uncharacterized protein LOC119066001 n=1 Tax=Bradysia coprophila TaxID=38358 RepID=UPI00187D7041|nr:uncharacterized protein LOC119066001 [Bradysia coprophila]